MAHTDSDRTAATRARTAHIRNARQDKRRELTIEERRFRALLKKGL